MNPTVLVRRCVAGGAILISGCLLLSACGGGTTANSASAGRPSVHGAAGSFAQRGALSVPASSAGSAGSGAAGRSAAQTSSIVPANQSIIYTATLTVRAASVTAAAKQATAIALGAGGYVADESASSGTPGRGGQTISLALKIPVSSYQQALAQLSSSAIGKQISMQQKATDVTEQVADVSSLVTSEQAAISALQGLLKRAASVSGLLQVQQQISSDESTLNSLQAQQRALNRETTYGTVTMTLVSPQHHRAAAHKKASRHNFLTGLASGWRALRHGVGWVLTALGAALPFLLVILVLGGIGYAGWRRTGKRRTKPTATS